MGLIQILNEETKASPFYNIRFSFEKNIYDLKENDKVSFGNNWKDGNINIQKILYQNKQIGFLKEGTYNSWLGPLCASFVTWSVNNENEDNLHYYEDEFGNMMAFAYLQDMIDYCKNNWNKIIKITNNIN